MTEAIYKQADMYCKEHGTEKNVEKAFAAYSKLFEEQMESCKDRYYGCKLVDVALRMGYCYENGEGAAVDPERAREYFMTAKEAIEKRIKPELFTAMR